MKAGWKFSGRGSGEPSVRTDSAVLRLSPSVELWERREYHIILSRRNSELDMAQSFTF